MQRDTLGIGGQPLREVLDFLRLAVLVELEIIPRQRTDRLAIGIDYRDPKVHQVDSAGEDGLLGRHDGTG